MDTSSASPPGQQTGEVRKERGAELFDPMSVARPRISSLGSPTVAGLFLGPWPAHSCSTVSPSQPPHGAARRRGPLRHSNADQLPGGSHGPIGGTDCPH